MAALSSGIVCIIEVASVQEYLRGSPRHAVSIKRFLVFALYSTYALQILRAHNLYLCENTLAIGIGCQGVQQIDDVMCFRTFYCSLVGVFRERRDITLWIMVAHMLVKPSLIEALRLLVCSRAQLPTKAGISELIGYLARRHGHVASRMPAGQRTWKQIDVFGIASTQTLGAKYAGSVKLYEQLEEYSKLVRIADKICDLDPPYRSHHEPVEFIDIVKAIDSVGLVCYARRGYWSVHLARALTPSFSGVELIGAVVYTEECAEVLFGMGSGAKTMALLGIPKAKPFYAMMCLCRCITSLLKAYGYEVVVDPATLACAACEAHRRNVMGAGIIERRTGL
jgi:hypothetical protein